MWKTVRLSDVCNVSIGKTPPRGNKRYWDKEKSTNNVWLSIADLSSSNDKYISDSKEYLSNEGASLFKPVPKNTLIMSFKLSIGKLAFTKCELRTNEAIAALSIIDESLVLKEFLYHYLSFLNWDVLAGHDQKVKGKTLNKKKLNAIEITLPPLAEQERIVAKLDAVFTEIERAIEVCKEQISANVQMKSHSLTSLFFSDDFVLRRVDEIASIKGGKRLPKGKKVTTKNTGCPYIRVSDFNDNGSVDEESVQFVEPDVQAEISRYTISSDDVYVSIAGTIGKTGIVPPSLDNANLTENAAKLVLKEGVDRDFIYFFTRTSSFEKQAIAQTRQTTQPKLALERLGVVELPIYELPQQRQIAFNAKLLSQEIAKVIKNREEKLLQLVDLKSSILTQELQPQHIEAT